MTFGDIAMNSPSEHIELDVHAHLIPVTGDGLEAVEGVTWDGVAKVMHVDGHVIDMKALFQPEALLGWMAKNHVRQAWISAPPPVYRQQLRGSAAHAWAEYLNRGLET